MTETIDGQRQYILFLENKISILMDRLSDLGQDLGDARNREVDYLGQVETLEMRLYDYEKAAQLNDEK